MHTEKNVQLLSYYKAVFSENQTEMPLFLLPFQPAVCEHEAAVIGGRKTKRMECGRCLIGSAMHCRGWAISFPM